jgi:anti-sigma factor RsiW
MNNHLSQDQFAKCVVGQSTVAERQHLMECATCTAESERFGNTLSLFRTALRDRVDDEAASNVTVLAPRAPQRTSGFSVLRWAFIASSVLVFISIPLLKREEPKSAIENVSIDADANALMDAVNLHLSRTVPAPMERMLIVIPNDESITQSGGTQ